jgi:uncharacterized protein (DUF2141 family)
MKKIILFCLVMTMAFPSIFAQNTVTVIIKNIEKATGKIEVGLYDSAKYWLGDDGQYFEKIFDCTNAPSMKLVIPNVEAGTYAFSLYHDENGNGEMDFRTWIPKEPYGFSNNPKSKWSKPSFNKCSFSVNGSDVTIEVNLEDW